MAEEVLGRLRGQAGAITRRRALTAGLAFTAAACSKGKQPVRVGSKSSTEQLVLGEIIAQHLERRLRQIPARKQNLGAAALAFQALQTGEIDLYPESTGTALLSIIKDPPASDPAVVFERVRLELQRTAQTVVLDPLGFTSRFAIAVRADDARKEKLGKLSDAAAVKTGWTLGAGREFQERLDGYAAMLTYRISWAAATRTMEPEQLYKALAEKQVSMIAVTPTDGPLNSPEITLLDDDRKIFTPYSTSIFVRQDALAREPGLQPALSELSGKFSDESLRKLNYQVDVEKKNARDAAAGFLKLAGLH